MSDVWWQILLVHLSRLIRVCGEPLTELKDVFIQINDLASLSFR